MQSRKSLNSNLLKFLTSKKVKPDVRKIIRKRQAVKEDWTIRNKKRIGSVLANKYT